MKFICTIYKMKNRNKLNKGYTRLRYTFRSQMLQGYMVYLRLRLIRFENNKLQFISKLV